MRTPAVTFPHRGTTSSVLLTVGLKETLCVFSTTKEGWAGVQLTQEQKNSLESQVSRYQNSLYVAAEYLEGRGITEDTAVSARLGVVDEPVHGDPEAAFNRLAIPYLTRSGVVDVRFRCLREHDCGDSGCPKYLGRPNVRPRLYNVSALVDAGDIIGVAEGELDALILNQLGYEAIGVPGVANWKPHWSRLFEDFERIVVFCDGDNAGHGFGKAWSERFPQSVELVSFPEGHDVNSMYLMEGPEWFEHHLW